jgi:hypothetical protein
VHRQRTIAAPVPANPERNSERHIIGSVKAWFFWGLLHRIKKLTPQLAITRKVNCAIWKPGNEAQKRHNWAKGTPGYQ